MPERERSRQLDFTDLGVGRDDYYVIKGTLHNPDYEFRTIPGIEAETGLPTETVEAVLTKAGIARESVFKDLEGNQCYAPVEQKKSLKENFAIIRYVLAN